MKPVLWLRLASVLTFIHALLHTIGGVFGKPAPGPQQAAVTAMKANAFPAMGNIRTLWDFHMGLGLGITIFLTVEAVVFWQLGSLAKIDAHGLRGIFATFMVGYLVFAVDSYRYFFLGPVITEIAIAASLALAMVAATFNRLRTIPGFASSAAILRRP